MLGLAPVFVKPRARAVRLHPLRRLQLPHVCALVTERDSFTSQAPTWECAAQISRRQERKATAATGQSNAACDGLRQKKGARSFLGCPWNGTELYHRTIGHCSTRYSASAAQGASRRCMHFNIRARAPSKASRGARASAEQETTHATVRSEAALAAVATH